MPQMTNEIVDVFNDPKAINKWQVFCLTMAAKYSKDREQFGRKISKIRGWWELRYETNETCNKKKKTTRFFKFLIANDPQIW